jgi:CRISPR-associated protein Cas5d
MTANFWYPVMKNGIIDFLPPEKCPIHKVLREMPIKTFNSTSNFIGLKEFEEVT